MNQLLPTIKTVADPCDTDPKEEDSDSTEEVTETFILCRSQDRKAKDQAIVKRAADKIAERLTSMTARCEKQNREIQKIEREVGRLLGQNTRASHLFDIQVKKNAEGFATIVWQKIKPQTEWHNLADGCYLLRSNVTDWSDEALWKAYIQLTEAENAFRRPKRRLLAIVRQSSAKWIASHTGYDPFPQLRLFERWRG